MTKSLMPLATVAFLALALPVQAQNTGSPDPADKSNKADPSAPAAPMMTATPPPQSVAPPASSAVPTAPSSNIGSLPSIAPPSNAAAAPGALKTDAPPSGTGSSPTAAAPAGPSPTLGIVNNAGLNDKGEKDGIAPAILKAEVMLDRLHASPGVIDGRDGANFEHALEIYEKAKGMKVRGSLNPEVWSALTAESGTPVLLEYVLTDQDVQGPYYPDLPTDYAQLATLPTIGYRTPSQKIGAKFHMGETLLAALNPGIDLSKAGGKILVADVTPRPIHEKVSSIIVDKVKSQVLGFDRKGTLLVAYPATIGSQELPSPSGTYKIKGVAYNPIYYYDPKNFLQGNNKGKLKLPPGPNNPVGSVFMALTKPTYGLHGTPDPSNIDKAASHGCVRMTNWDANELAHLVKRGIVVRFKG